MKKRLRDYLWNILVGLDQFLNTMCAGHPDETFSARAYRKASAGQRFWRIMRYAIDKIFFWQPAHCRQAFESEARRGHSPAEFTNIS